MLSAVIDNHGRSHQGTIQVQEPCHSVPTKATSGLADDLEMTFSHSYNESFIPHPCIKQCARITCI